METAFELSLAAVLNMRTVDWNTPFKAVKYSTALAIISLIFLGVLIPFSTVFYIKYFSKLKQKGFRNKYGAGVESTKVETTTPYKSIVVHPAIFFGRRIVFAFSAVYLGYFLWAQLFIQMTVSLLVAGYLVVFKPMNSPQANIIELMNECTILLLTYTNMLFTHYIPEPETRKGIGYAYILIVLANIAVHMVFLFRDSCLKAKFVYKRC